MFEESTSASSCGMVAKVTKAKMTVIRLWRTDNGGERAANWSADVEIIERDNDSMARDDETIIVLNANALANANAMELKQFLASAEAHASDETMKQAWDFQLNGIEWTARAEAGSESIARQRAAECGKGLRAIGMECSIGIASGHSARTANANYNSSIVWWHCAEKEHFKREFPIWLRVQEAIAPNDDRKLNVLLELNRKVLV